MGIYINRGNEGFRQIRNSEYIDKSALIAVVNKTLFTQQKLSCVTRCRSFWAGTSSFDNVVSYIQRNFEGLKDDILLVGISYDKDTKEHQCQIERCRKE